MSSCSDADGGPLAVLVAPETHGAVLFSDQLSTLPTLFSNYSLEGEGAPQVESWWESWEMEGPVGAELRSRIRPLAARRLLPVLGSGGVRDLVGRNGMTMATVSWIASFLESTAIETALASALESHGQASVALAGERWEEALTLALETTDALWRVTPPQVAKDLIREAKMALGRKQNLETYSQKELIRIRRLMYGATEALEAGDYPGAIRRAYYACQLLGANPP
jgi:hypothetical protein